MANSGPNTNSSQFFMTTAETPWLDGKHTVFGRVVQGAEIVDKMDKLGTQSGKPRAKVKIVDCGEIFLDGPKDGLNGGGEVPQQSQQAAPAAAPAAVPAAVPAPMPAAGGA